MTLQSSGTSISISQINTEVGRASNASNTSMQSLENGTHITINTASTNRPNGSSPHAMSEWYSYNHSASPTVTMTGASINTSTDEFSLTWTYAGLPSGGYFTLEWYDDANNTSTTTINPASSAQVVGAGAHGYDLVTSGTPGSSAQTFYYTVNMKNSGGTTVATASTSFTFYRGADV